MRIYFATWLLESAQGEALTKVGGKKRLISYHLNKDVEAELPHYLRTGRNEGLPRKHGSRKRTQSGVPQSTP